LQPWLGNRFLPRLAANRDTFLRFEIYESDSVRLNRKSCAILSQTTLHRKIQLTA
jgi:hypothetical protein